MQNAWIDLDGCSALLVAASVVCAEWYRAALFIIHACLLLARGGPHLPASLLAEGTMLACAREQPLGAVERPLCPSCRGESMSCVSIFRSLSIFSLISRFAA